MLELIKTLSDDQIALLGCAAALSLAGTIMSLSYYIGRGRLAQTGPKSSRPLMLASQTAKPQMVVTEIPAERREAA